MIHEVYTSEDLAAIDEDETFVLLFTQPSSCAPCRALEPHFERVADMRDDVVFRRVNLDTADIALAQEWGVMGVPQLFIVKGDFSSPLAGRTVVSLTKELDALI
jgi:thiol-disulfide isomerase/thioredoxin